MHPLQIAPVAMIDAIVTLIASVVAPMVTGANTLRRIVIAANPTPQDMTILSLAMILATASQMTIRTRLHVVAIMTSSTTQCLQALGQFLLAARLRRCTSRIPSSLLPTCHTVRLEHRHTSMLQTFRSATTSMSHGLQHTCQVIRPLAMVATPRLRLGSYLIKSIKAGALHLSDEHTLWDLAMSTVQIPNMCL